MQEKMPTHYLVGNKLVEHKSPPTLSSIQEKMKDRIRVLAETLDGSENMEIKYLSERQVMDQIVLLAEEDGISLADLNDEGEIQEDANNNLLCLAISVKPEVAKQKKSKGIGYIYMAKGDHDEAGYFRVASITRFEPEDPSKAKLLCIYLDRQGKWAKPSKS